jgi:phospholipid-translocating ATPase
MSKLFRRHLHPDELETDDESDTGIDDDLRLRTVTTAASTIAESIRSEQRAARRKRNSRRSRFFGRSSEKRKGSVRSNPPQNAPQEVPQAVTVTSKPRRNIYVNSPLPAQELRSNGDPWVRYERNKVRTSSCVLSTNQCGTRLMLF